MNTRRIAANELEFEIIEAGESNADKVLLVHGFTGSKEDFDDHLDALAGRGWHAVAADHRGHGQSAKPEGEHSYSMSLMADDMLALVDALGWDGFVLLGHSMGGMVAQIMATQLGDRLRGLVLMDTSPVCPDGLDPQAIEIGKTLVRERGLDFLVELQQQRGPLDTPAHQRVLATRADYAARGDYKIRNVSPDMWCAVVTEIIDQPDRCDALREVDVPALVIVGEQDTPFMPHSERMAKTLPQGRLAVIPDAGHSPQFESPDAWWSALTTFLDEARA
jgi:pimeloyl-ACP methyl ester carboxylesterase